jgi:hypothetical protein
MAHHTLTVRRMIIEPERVLLYDDAAFAFCVIGHPSLQYSVTINDVITYAPAGMGFGWYVATAPAVRPAQP